MEVMETSGDQHPVEDSAPPSPITPKKKGFLRRAWAGEERLWKVWWLIGIPLALVSGAFSMWYDAQTVPTTTTWIVAGVGAWGLLTAYLCWCNMAWSCAKNVKNPVWTRVAKVLIILGLVTTFLDLILTPLSK